MKKHMIHALRTHAKRTLAAAFAAAFALGSALTLSACSGKPAKQTGSNSTLVPQTEVPTVSATATPATTTPAPAETATPFIDPTDPPATPVPVVGEYTKPCQKVKVDFPATDSTRAFSVTFDLPEGWTVRSDEGVYTDSSYSDFGFNLHGRKLLYDENGNLAGAVGFHSYGAEGYAEYGYREAFAPFALGHVKYFDWDNYHFVDGDSSNCESVYSVSYHGISSAALIDGWGFHPFYCPTAVSCCVTGNPVSVAVELSNTYEDSASLSKRVAESIRFE